MAGAAHRLALPGRRGGGGSRRGRSGFLRWRDFGTRYPSAAGWERAGRNRTASSLGIMTTESSRGLLARRWQLAVPVVAAAAGVLFVASAVSSGGTDLRASGTDLEAVVQQRANTVDDLRQRLRELQAEVDSLGVIVGDDSVRDLRSRVAVVGADAGITPVSGPGLVVTLDDSPLEEAPEGFDPNELVVHQQDIQAFVNAMWAGGATAVSLQGQRLVSSTGIKCVGNTVVLEGCRTRRRT